MTDKLKVLDRVEFADGGRGKIVKMLDGKAVVVFDKSKTEYIINLKSLKKI